MAKQPSNTITNDNQFIPNHPSNWQEMTIIELFKYQPNQFTYLSDDAERKKKIAVPPPKGPFPGITHEEYGEFNIEQQREYLRFLKEVGEYYQKWIPNYQIKMEEFLTNHPGYRMTPEEDEIMRPYLNQQARKRYEEETKRIKEEQLKQQEDRDTQETEMHSNTHQANELSQLFDQGSKLYEIEQQFFEKENDIIEKRPSLVKYPLHPSCVNIESFKLYYGQFLDFYQPTTDFTRFPQNEEKQKSTKEKKTGKQNQNRKKEPEKIVVVERQYKRLQKQAEQQGSQQTNKKR